jgi:hypothetical protein
VAAAGASAPQRPRPPAQSYANHVHRPVATAVAGLFAIVGLALFIALVFREGSLVIAVGGVSLALAVMTLVVMSRTYTVRLQNRIIRVEMLLRLERLGRGAAFRELTMPQIAALRFASDAELSALVDRALAEDLNADQIKRAVKDWQGDYFRT